MAKFQNGDTVVHLGGVSGLASRNRGVVLTIKDGPLRIYGYSGQRYIVDRPLFMQGGVSATAYHANEQYLLKLR